MNQEPDSKLEAILAELEPPYRSHGEAQVGRLLDRYGVPFFYEQPLLVLDRDQHRVLYPDFTLPDYNDLIIEYAGMPDVVEYMDGSRHKQEAYQANEIPALFVYPQDLTGAGWPERLYERINEAGERAMRHHDYAPEGSVGRPSYSGP